MQYVNTLKEYLAEHYFNSSIRKFDYILRVYLTVKFVTIFFFSEQFHEVFQMYSYLRVYLIPRMCKSL